MMQQQIELRHRDERIKCSPLFLDFRENQPFLSMFFYLQVSRLLCSHRHRSDACCCLLQATGGGDRGTESNHSEPPRLRRGFWPAPDSRPSFYVSWAGVATMRRYRVRGGRARRLGTRDFMPYRPISDTSIISCSDRQGTHFESSQTVSL